MQKTDAIKYADQNRWLASLMAGLLAVVIFSPQLFGLMNSLTTKVNRNLALTDSQGRPNLGGLAVHGVVFALITRGVMEI